MNLSDKPQDSPTQLLEFEVTENLLIEVLH